MKPDLEVIDLPKDFACQALTVDELAPLSQGWAARSNVVCQAIQLSEYLHAAVVDEMSLHAVMHCNDDDVCILTCRHKISEFIETVLVDVHAHVCDARHTAGRTKRAARVSIYFA